MDVRPVQFRSLMILGGAFAACLVVSASNTASANAGCGDYLVPHEIRTGWRLFVRAEPFDRMLRDQRTSLPRPCEGPSCRQSTPIAPLAPLPQQVDQRWEAITDDVPPKTAMTPRQWATHGAHLNSSLFVARIDRPPECGWLDIRCAHIA